MNDTNAEQPEGTPLPYGSARFPANDDQTGNVPEPDGVVSSGGRMEANTALLKISRSAADNSGEIDNNSSGLMGFGSGSGVFQPNELEEDEDPQSAEAASARIAQEYRRQVRIKRLAEEIQQAERDKKKDVKRRKDGTDIRGSEMKRKDETAKLSLPENGEGSTDSENEQSKRRAEAMQAFKKGRKSSGVWLAVAAAIILLVCTGIGGMLLWNSMNNKNRELALDLERRNREMVELQKKNTAVNPEIAILKEKMETERIAREAADKLALEEKRDRELAQKKQEERDKELRDDRERVLAELKRSQESAKKFEEENRRRDEELGKRAEEASRIAREKMKLEQQLRQAAIAEAEAKSVAATPQGEVRTSPPQPVGIAGKSDLPTGAVRLFCKASDPYGGRLNFNWKQIKGPAVEIADPNFSLLKDGKWYSQTYFVATAPGSYEFELSVKNEDGVETLRKYPIDVLPATTLK